MNRYPDTVRGFTLIELLVFIIIVTIGLLGSMMVFSTAVRGSADPMVRKQALNHAEAMLREVMQKSFQNDAADALNSSATLGCTPNTNPVCQPNSQLNRPNYNDVDDYQGYNQPVTTLAGGAIPGVACTQAVAVAVGALNGVNGNFITVTAVCGNETIVLTGFRGNF